GEVSCGRMPYDFSRGTMFFLSPGQLVGHAVSAMEEAEGWILFFDRSYLAHHPLHRKILDLPFFDYAVTEALHLSAAEERSMEQIFDNIQTEYLYPIDRHSRDVVAANLELCTTYADRYYHRQFLTRSYVEGNFLTVFDGVLKDRFGGDRLESEGIPTIPELAAELNMSAKYLSEKLRHQTGKTAQDYVHLRLLERAKVLLRDPELTVGEVAYRLGFRYPQYFSRFFSKRTGRSPKVYRAEVS
ncbi:MAG: helix-turn-helix transcriptional regulator, partial [Bacteroidota bacterium]